MGLVVLRLLLVAVVGFNCLVWILYFWLGLVLAGFIWYSVLLVVGMICGLPVVLCVVFDILILLLFSIMFD